MSVIKMFELCAEYHRTLEHFMASNRERIAGHVGGRVAEGLVRREDGETFGLGVALGSQEVKQTQGLIRRSQLRLPRVTHGHRS